MLNTKKLVGVFFLVSACLGVGCSAAVNKAVVTKLVEVALAECVAENLGETDDTLQKVCGFTQDNWPLVRRLILANEKGEAKKAAKKKNVVLVSDAGVEGGK